MKSKLTLLAFAVTVLAMVGGIARAQNLGISVRANTDIEVGAQADSNRGVNTRASTSVSATVRGNATSTAAKNNRATTTQGNATTTAGAQGKLMSEAHRSVVATFVKSLLAVADREGGIGTQVRVVARSQNDSATTTATAMAKVEGRGPLRTFFFGSDYKNLGVIRREIATTTANINRLKTLLNRVTNEAGRVELAVQIQALEAEQARVKAYVVAHQDVFSLFGWFNRLLVE